MIRLPRNSQTPLRMSLEFSGALSRDRIPDPYGLIHGASGDMFAFGAPCDSQNPACVSLQSLRGSASIGIPDSGSVVTTSCCETAGGDRRELASENGLTVTGDLVGHSRYGMDLEDALWLGAESDGGFKGVRDAMFFEEAEKIGRELVDDELCSWDMDPESVGSEVFAVLNELC